MLVEVLGSVEVGTVIALDDLKRVFAWHRPRLVRVGGVPLDSVLGIILGTWGDCEKRKVQPRKERETPKKGREKRRKRVRERKRGENRGRGLRRLLMGIILL